LNAKTQQDFVSLFYIYSTYQMLSLNVSNFVLYYPHLSLFSLKVLIITNALLFFLSQLRQSFFVLVISFSLHASHSKLSIILTYKTMSYVPSNNLHQSA